MSKPDKKPPIDLEKPKFEALVLVCRDCEDRSDAPRHLKARELRKSLKHHLAYARCKMRVVECSCLGLCPKKAMTVAAFGPGAKPLCATVRSDEDAAAFAEVVVEAFR